MFLGFETEGGGRTFLGSGTEGRMFGCANPGGSQGSAHHPSPPAGVRMGSLGLFLQCITSIFFSTIMDRLVKHFGTRAVYLASVVFFPGAAFVMCLSRSVTVVTISAALTGFTFSALQILPYTLASLYHHDKQVRDLLQGAEGSLALHIFIFLYFLGKMVWFSYPCVNSAALPA